MRRSELVALDLADLEWTAEGVLIHISAQQDRSGRPWPVRCGSSWRYGMPCCGAAGMDRRGRHRRGRGIPAHLQQEGAAGDRSAATWSSHCQHREEGRCPAWLRRVGIRCTQPAVRSRNQRRQARRQPSEDMRPNPAQVSGDAARVLPRCRAICRQCGCGSTLRKGTLTFWAGSSVNHLSFGFARYFRHQPPSDQQHCYRPAERDGKC